jgi:RNA polymerase sigma factor (sigma-70 family)
VTEEEVLRALAGGGRVANSAVKAFYVRYAQHMLKFFVYQGASSEEAKDILQETIVKIVRNAHSFEGTGSARAWIWQIARNCLLDALGKRSRQLEVPASNDDAWQEIPAPCGRTDLEVQECVDRGLAEFAKAAPERAYALTMYLDDMSMEEIGERIGRTTSATKEFLSQCRKKVREYVAHCAEFLEAT